MMCDECGQNPATIRLMTIVNGEKQERCLCAQCMERMKNQFTAFDLGSLAGVLSGLLMAAKKQGQEAEDAPYMNLTCERCGTSYESFKKTGFLGCANCYRAFQEPLDALLKRVHGNTQHTGRVPGGVNGEVSIRLSIDKLKQQLVRAVSQEAYEEAAALRDRIRALNEELEKAEEAISHE